MSDATAHETVREASRPDQRTLPDSPFLQIWDAIIVLAGTAIAILVPLDLVLGIRSARSARAIGDFVTVLFFIDIAVSAWRLRGTRNPKGFIAAPGIRSYVTRWLLVDVIAAVPWSLLLGAGWTELARLVKLDKVRAILAEWMLRELRYADELVLAFVLFTMLLATHWITCGWIAIRGVTPDVPIATAYIDALYWTISTLTTVGYGDVVPRDSIEKVYAIGTMIVGFAFLGYLIGLLATVWARRDPARLKFRENIERLATATKYARLPRSLQRRVYDYHYYVWKRRLGYDEVGFLSELPRNLRSEVSLHMKRYLLENGELFRGADPEFVREIAVHLRPLVLTPGDVAFHEGEEGRDMYFLARGEVEIVSGPDQTRLAVLAEGSYFGEIALLENVPRTATVRALDYCDVYSLSRSAFETVVLHHPEVMSQIREKAHARGGDLRTRDASARS
jgi:voltage-gated potassium channel Kch